MAGKGDQRQTPETMLPHLLQVSVCWQTILLHPTRIQKEGKGGGGKKGK